MFKHSDDNKIVIHTYSINYKIVEYFDSVYTNNGTSCEVRDSIYEFISLNQLNLNMHAINSLKRKPFIDGERVLVIDALSVHGVSGYIIITDNGKSIEYNINADKCYFLDMSVHPENRITISPR